MKFDRMDITDTRSIVFKQLETLDKRARYLNAQAERVKELNRMLVYLIQEGKIIETEDIDCAISWLNNSTLSANEIIKKII